MKRQQVQNPHSWFESRHMCSNVMTLAGTEYPYPGIHTPAYAAPEHLAVQGIALQQPVTQYKPQDMWSIGCLLAEMLINCQPFARQTESMDTALTKAEVEDLIVGQLQSRHAEWVRSP